MIFFSFRGIDKEMTKLKKKKKKFNLMVSLGIRTLGRLNLQLLLYTDDFWP